MAAMIGGRTKLIGILADPIDHVRTPAVLNPLLEARGADAVVVPLHVDAAGLKALWPGLRALRSLAGLIVTVPHKTAVVGLVDRLGEAGQLAGAVNVIRREPDGTMVGDTFDGRGFVEGLRAHGHEPAGRRVLLLGAGGAAAAIALALVRAGIAGLRIVNRSQDRAERLAARLQAAGAGMEVEAGPAEARAFDLVVNATSLGLRASDPLPCDLAGIGADAIVADAVMQPPETAFLAEARRLGAIAHPGLPMLEGQRELLLGFLGFADRPSSA
jgi:shikimate dehydrogenase